MPGDGWRDRADALLAGVRAVVEPDHEPSEVSLIGAEQETRRPGTDDSTMLIQREIYPVDGVPGGSRGRVSRERPSWGQVELGHALHTGVGEPGAEGAPCVWDMAQTPHLFFVGGTGRGKTTLGVVLAGAWLCTGWDVVWASPTAGADPVPDGALVVSDPGEVSTTLTRVAEVVQSRAEMLQATGVGRFDELDPVPVPVLVVVDGAFAYTGAAVASKGPSRRIRAALTTLLGQGRAVGVSVVLFSHAARDVLRVRAFASNLPGRGVFLDCDEEVWESVFGGKRKPRESSVFTGCAAVGEVTGSEPGRVAVMVPGRGRRSGPVAQVRVELGVCSVGGAVQADGPRMVADE